MGKKFLKEEIETRSIIIALLRAGSDFGIDVFGLISIDTLEDGTIRIINQLDEEGNIEDGKEKTFPAKDLKKAVDYFLKLRRDRKLGYDHECS